jgi:hypothetical protein
MESRKHLRRILIRECRRYKKPNQQSLWLSFHKKQTDHLLLKQPAAAGKLAVDLKNQTR